MLFMSCIVYGSLNSHYWALSLHRITPPAIRPRHATTGSFPDVFVVTVVIVVRLGVAEEPGFC